MKKTFQCRIQFLKFLISFLVLLHQFRIWFFCSCYYPFQALKETLDKLEDDTMKKRVRHVITEIARVNSFVRAFANGKIDEAGRLFNASHDSLAADYEVTVPELDIAVDVARVNGAYGARMTGGGFGGSIIALVDKGQGHEIAQKIADRFEKEGFNAPRALPAFAAASASREA